MARLLLTSMGTSASSSANRPQISQRPTDERLALELWSQNMLNQKYYQVAYDAPFQSGSYDAFLGQPRTYGATIRVKY